MKKFLIILFLMLGAVYTSAEIKQALTLHLESGTNIVYFLDSEPSITFDEQDMIVTADGESRAIPMSSVDRWSIGLAEYSDAEPVITYMETAVIIYGNEVSVSNPASHSVIIMNLKGQIVGTSNAPDARFTVSSGIYVIKVANNTYKIAVR